MKGLYIKINDEDHGIIKGNIKSVSHAMGKPLNVSALVRHVLLGLKSKKALYDLGYISLVELNDQSKKIKLPTNRISKIKKVS